MSKRDVPTSYYNCAGYALGIRRWIRFPMFEDNLEIEDEDATLDLMYKRIERLMLSVRHKRIERIYTPNNAPDDVTVVGFRLAIDDGNFDDFHFIKRDPHTTVWMHKMGWSGIYEYRHDIFGHWCRDRWTPYNSSIVWFTYK